MEVLLFLDYSKGEFGLGQHELNVKYAEVLEMADRHSVYKQVHSPLNNKCTYGIQVQNFDSTRTRPINV